MPNSQTNRSLSASLGHIQNGDSLRDEKAYEILTSTDAPLPKTNMTFDICEDINIGDARYHGTDKFSLEEQGFAFLQHSFEDNLALEQIQGPDGDRKIEQYLMEVLRAIEAFLIPRKTIIYDWRVRSTQREPSTPKTANRNFLLPPAAWIHADESAECGRKVILEHLTDEEIEAFNTGKGRFRIINIWRPLVPIVEEAPLVLCDRRSVAVNDWELCDQIHADRVDEAMYLKQKDSHQWWWLPSQRDDELSFFVVWDSSWIRENEQASTPHGAVNLQTPPSKEGRQSIEVRSIIWTES